jgi:hypothetical protein
MNPRVMKVFPNDDYTLILHFSNGEIKKFDVHPLLGQGVFTNLQDKSVFKMVQVSLGTVEWPGEIDICPDTLYEDGQKIN